MVRSKALSPRAPELPLQGYLVHKKAPHSIVISKSLTCRPRGKQNLRILKMPFKQCHKKSRNSVFDAGPRCKQQLHDAQMPLESCHEKRRTCLRGARLSQQLLNLLQAACLRSQAHRNDFLFEGRPYVIRHKQTC